MCDDPKSLSDRELAARVAQGRSRDEVNDCLDALIARYWPELFGYVRARRRCVQKVLEILAEIAFQFWNSLRNKHFDVEQPVKPYLFRIAEHTLIDDHRREQKHNETASLETCHDGDNEEAGKIDPVDPKMLFVDQLMRREEVQRVLDALSSEDRELLIWRHMEGRTPQEIADSREVPPPTIYRRLDRARRRFQRRWQEIFGNWPEDL